MSRALITVELYSKLIEAYRSLPGRVKDVSRITGVSNNLAWRAWSRGFVRAPVDCRRAIKDVLADEHEYLRAQLREAQETTQAQMIELEARRRADVSEKARKDASESRVEEIKIARMARASALQTLSTALQLNAGVAELGAQLRVALGRLAAQMNEIDPATGQVRGVKPRELADYVRLFATLTSADHAAVNIGMRAIEIERVIAGEPTRMLGVRVENVSMADAARHMELLRRGLERLERQGKMIDVTPTKELTEAVTLDDIKAKAS